MPKSHAMASRFDDITRFETSAVHTDPAATLDIVLVHGLNGDPVKTWTSDSGVYWPVDLLPADLDRAGVHANILVYGYNADVLPAKSSSRGRGGSASNNFIHEHAQTLVTTLTAYRRDAGTHRNPIVWICHSLGGILVKRALLYSSDLSRVSPHHLHHHDEPYRSLYVSTFGIMFLATPHTGSQAADWGHVLQRMAKAVMPGRFRESESVLLKTLKKENETLANINNHFLDIYHRFSIHMAHENQKTDVKGTKMFIVDTNSAELHLPGVYSHGVEATHEQICKFDTKSSPGYRILSSYVRQWILEAPATIYQRWQVEEEETAARAFSDLQERVNSPVLSMMGSRMGSPTAQSMRDFALQYGSPFTQNLPVAGFGHGSGSRSSPGLIPVFAAPPRAISPLWLSHSDEELSLETSGRVRSGRPGR